MIVSECATNPLVMFDDDGPGEVADIVAIHDGDELVVRLFHCKYSKVEEPGLRVEDICKLCGQAQKCVKWGESVERLLNHLRRRETKRMSAGASTRFEVGVWQSWRRCARSLVRSVLGLRSFSFSQGSPGRS